MKKKELVKKIFKRTKPEFRQERIKKSLLRWPKEKLENLLRIHQEND